MTKLLPACLLIAALCGAVSAETILSEDFEGSFPPTGWTLYSVDPSSTYEHSGTNSAKLSAAEDYLITPPLTNSHTLTLWTYATSDTLSFHAETSTNAVGPWTAVTGSPFANIGGQWTERIIPIVSPEPQYIRFTKTGSGNLYIDDIDVDDAPPANSLPILAAIGSRTVIVSNSLNFSVSATDINGDTITLSATNLPPGATFTPVTHAGAVSSTFTWMNSAPTGTYTTTFFADDGTTNVSETITITVTEPPVLPTHLVYDFADDPAVYDLLDDQTGPVAVSNCGLVATFTASSGTMNRTAEGFGINASISGDDTTGFDTSEWIDITFNLPVVLTNVSTASWGSNDVAILYINGISNDVITTSGPHPLELTIPAEQVLRIAATNGVVGNGWSLERIAIRTDTNAPPNPDADTDGDGICNGDELIAGTDPNSPASCFRITETTMAGSGHSTLNWTAAPGRRYTIWWTDSLTNGFIKWATFDAPTNHWTDIDHTTDTDGFYRMDVQLIE